MEANKTFFHPAALSPLKERMVPSEEVAGWTPDVVKMLGEGQNLFASKELEHPDIRSPSCGSSNRNDWGAPTHSVIT